jgi:hypothetical protein
MHPLDAPKLRRIAERLFEISEGRLANAPGQLRCSANS